MQQETLPKLLKACESELVDAHASVLVEKDTGCDTMFKNKKLEELALMYRVYNRVPETLKYILEKMQPYINERGNKIVQDEAIVKEPLTFTKKLLDLKAEMDDMTEKSFKNDAKFQKTRN